MIKWHELAIPMLLTSTTMKDGEEHLVECWDSKETSTLTKYMSWKFPREDQKEKTLGSYCLKDAELA